MARFHLSLGGPSGDTGSLPLQGPKGESVGSITQPLPSSYLIFRAASESDGESYLPHRSQRQHPRGSAPWGYRPGGSPRCRPLPLHPRRRHPAVRGRAQDPPLAGPSVSLSFPVAKCE